MQISSELSGGVVTGTISKGNDNGSAHSLQGRTVGQDHSFAPVLSGLIARYLPLQEADRALQELGTQFGLPVDEVTEREAFCGREQARFTRQVDLFLDNTTKTLEFGKG